jgi:uncharacterized membrane protein
MFTKKTTLLLVFFLLVCITSSYGATIHGKVYDYNLNIVKDAVVSVNTIPEQIYVADDGTYRLILNTGNYIIKAKYESNFNKYSFEQNITVLDEGDYVFDIILFPDIDDETEIFNESTEIPNIHEEAFSVYWWQIIIVLFLLTLVLFLMFNQKKKRKNKINGLDKDLKDDVLAFIKKQGGRTTQKDIRKEFPVSEAKVSLVITELEHDKKVKRIKKGRGNIIILNK